MDCRNQNELINLLFACHCPSFKSNWRSTVRVNDNSEILITCAVKWGCH